MIIVIIIARYRYSESCAACSIASFGDVDNGDI